MPGSDTQYYILTVNAADQAATGINYNIVDMTMNGGLGAVTSKNNPMLGGSTAVGGIGGTTVENVTAIPKTDGTGYWMINRTNTLFHV